jgi:DNA primase
MSPIPDEIIEQVRDAADIVAIIGRHVDLKRTGSDYRGPCPFHGGTNRNLAVIPKKQMFYCFVCHEAGDVFSFFMKREGLEYPAAVRLVAGELGIEIPERTAPGPDPNEPLYDAVSLAADWYARQLRESPDARQAREYLARRGFDVEKQPELGFGFAARDERFTDAMRNLGLTDEVMLEAGLLVTRDDGSVRPRFWNRLLIPIHDLRGRPVGFGGRLLGDGEPKYLNSSDNKLFHKGQLLYNLHHAKQSIRRHEGAIVVEGYFDVLKLSLVGVENVVASLGTAFTADQAKLLARYCKEVTILYDSDRAGLKATFRAADVMLGAGLRVTVATLPEGEDPDTLATEGGAAAIRRVVGDALDVCERKIQLMERAGMLATVPGRRRALDKLLPTLRATSDPVSRDLYISLTAEALGTSRESVAREADRKATAAVHQPETRFSEAPISLAQASLAERTIVLVLVHHPNLRASVTPSLPAMSLSDVGREVVTALCELPAEAGISDVMVSLSATGRQLLQSRYEQAAPPADFADRLLGDSMAGLESDRSQQRISEIDREFHLLSDDEKDARMREKKELVVESVNKRAGKWKL